MIKRNILDCMTLVGGTPLRFEGEKTYVSTGAVDCDHVDYAQTERVTYDNRPSRANLSVAEGDILFAKMCGTKKTLRIDRPLSEHLYSTGFCAVRANESLMDAALLYHLLASDQFLTQKDQNSSGATQKAITNAGLRKIVIQVPDLPEQRKLAANLDCIEQMMANHREQLVSFDQLVKSRFIELFGDPVLNQHGWRKVALEVNATLLNGRAYKQDELLDSGKYPVLRVGNFFSNRGWYYSDLELDDDKYCDNGDLLYAWSASFGPQIWNGGKVIYHYHIWKVLVGEAYNKQFLCKLLEYATESLMGDTHGIAMMHLTKSGMEKTEFIVPPIERQEQFAAFVEQTDKSKLFDEMEVAA